MEESVNANQNCFFCNVHLGASSRNSFNIFKTTVVTIQKQASELISDVIDVDVTEEDTHSKLICKKCFNLVHEFAELELRAAEIRTELSTKYNTTKGALAAAAEEEEEETMEQDDANEVEDELQHTQLTLSELVAGAGSNSLSELLFDAEGGNVAKLLLVNNGEYEEVELSAVIGEKLDNEETNDEVDDDDEMDETVGTLEDYEGSENVLESVDDMHVCRLCNTEGGEQPFSCETKNLSLMNVHLRHEHQVRIFICDICGAEFKKRLELNAHVDLHVAQEEGEFQCEVCKRIFNNLRLYRIHKRLHQPQNKAWNCDICHKKFSSRNLLEEHQNRHAGIRPYVCQSCGKSFASKYTYKAHVKTHEARERNFGCRQCGKTFLSWQNLQQHHKTHSEAKDYVCDFCGKGFGSLRNLEVHSVVHSGVKPFVCSTCGKAFARKAEIKDHERTHTGERPFQCEHCGAQFSQRSNLQSHKRVTHYNDRRYLCGDCGKGFKRRRLLDYHMKAVHTGERPYQCATCDATFVYPEHYKKHIRIHTGIKPYKCEVCEKAFNSRDNRNAHRFVHSDKKPYECLVCGLGFMRKPLLYNHMQQAGHINDTIVVNQPRLEKDDGTLIATDLDNDNELTIVEEGVMRTKKKVYLTGFNEHVIIDEGDLDKFDEGNLRALNSDEEFTDEMTMNARINEQGQLVNEDGNLITEDGQPIIVDEINNDNDIIIKTEHDQDSIQYVQIRVPEVGDSQKAWLNIDKKEEDDSID